MSTKLTQQQLDSIFGKIFSCTNYCRSPYVVRVIGFTNAKIIVEPIPMIYDLSKSAIIDQDWVKNNPCNEIPLKTIAEDSNSCTLSIFKVKQTEDSGVVTEVIYLIRKADLYAQCKVDDVFTWDTI